MIRFYFVLGLFFAFPFLWLAIAFWSWVWLAISAGVAILGGIWFRSAAFSKMLNVRHAIQLSDEWVNGVLMRIAQESAASVGKNWNFRFWRISESEAQCLVWLNGSDLHLLISQGLLARASEEQLQILFRNILQSNLRQIQNENRLYALSLWWDELKGQQNRFRYCFVSFWLYPLERLLKIAKI